MRRLASDHQSRATTRATTRASRIGLIALAGLCIAFAGPRRAGAQYDSARVEMLSQIPLSSFPSHPASGNDCWGYVSPSGREYALMGLNNALAVVEVSDPRNPVIVGSVPHNASNLGDVKTYGHYCYVTNNSTVTQVIDLDEVDRGVVTLAGSITASPHNLAVDEQHGYLYGPDTRGACRIWSLADPDDPTLAGEIQQALHDVQIHTYDDGPFAGRQIVFASAKQAGLIIYDATSKSHIVELSRVDHGGVYCHQGWLTQDEKYFLINDEQDELSGVVLHTTTYVIDVSDITRPFLAATFTSGSTSTDHNLFIKGSFCFEANYKSGLRIFDVSDPLAAVQTGWFDTFPSGDSPGYNGAWSNYPFFPSGNVIVSDISRGLFVFDVSAALGRLIFSYPNGLPQRLDPQGATIRVEVMAQGIEVQPGSGVLHFNDGGGWVDTPMQVVDVNIYDAVFGPIECGRVVDYYFTAEDTNGYTHFDPPRAPQDTYTATAVVGRQIAFHDDFQQDRGWTVQQASARVRGVWQRTTPGGARLAPDHDYDGSGRCYVTATRNSEIVQGAPVILTSPIFDLHNAELAFARFARWVYCNNGDDFLELEASGDGGLTWTPVAQYAANPRWIRETVNIGDYVPLTDRVRVRFLIADRQRNSYTNAAVDAFDLIVGDCGRLGPGSAGSLRLRAGGACGVADGCTIEWAGAQGASPLVLFASAWPGAFDLPAWNACAGVTLGLTRPTVAGTFDSGAGRGRRCVTVPRSACGAAVQLLQVSDCTLSNVERLP